MHESYMVILDSVSVLAVLVQQLYAGACMAGLITVMGMVLADPRREEPWE